MASRRVLLRFSSRVVAPAIARQSLPVSRAFIPQCPKAIAPRLPTVTQREQRRWHSAPASNSKVYDFEKIKSIVESPQDDTILIDVREPHEYEAGFIPTAINIPISSQPDALFLSPEEFEDRFGIMKPPPQKELVFYCKAGVRSSAAAQLAQQQGYKNVAEYRGSWLDWEKNGGESSKSPKVPDSGTDKASDRIGGESDTH